jgi:dihydrofolate synthase/folylpolyglutamate synthase
MLHSILAAEGYRVALYTSPHLGSFTERIRVGKEEISQEEVVELADEIRRRSTEGAVSLTFFEFVTVMALVYFATRKVDVAVVEVGMGGRWDATNLVMPKISVITTISKDHEVYLGSELLSIAREKAGIIKQGVPVVCGSVSLEVGELLRRIAEGKGSTIFFLGKDFSVGLKEGAYFDYRGMEWNLADLALALRGRYQRGNAAIVLAALETMRQDFPVAEEAIRKGLATVFWPGRFEVVGRSPRIILDGAHNGEGVKALVKEVREIQGTKKVRMLFAAMADKDWPFMLKELLTVASEVVLTRVPMERSADPNSLKEAVPKEVPATVVEDPLEAMDYLVRSAGANETILVAGSLYLLGKVRPLLVNRASKESSVRESAESGL